MKTKGIRSRKFKAVLGMFLCLGLLSAGYTATKITGMKSVPGPTRSGGAAANGLGDRTGSPNSSATCASCHSGGSFNPTMTIEVKDALSNPVTSYIPGNTYTVEYTVVAGSGTPQGYGMQSVILNSSNTNSGNMVTANTTNSQITNAGGFQYLEHQGFQAGGFFSVDWTAPSAGTGPVSIFGISLAVNGSGNTAGDQVTPTQVFSLTESVPTTISYAGNPYCADAPNASPVVTGEQGGTYSAPVGLDINGSSGEINISNSTPGTYTVTYTGATETATFNVTIHPTYNTSESATICSNETYQFGSQTLTAANAGLNTEVFQSVNGCDSTVELTLSVTQTTSTQVSETICANETFVFNGQTLDASNAGLNTFTTSGTNGCDSTVELTLTVLPLDTVQISDTICPGETYDFNGQILDESNAGLNVATLTNVNGCDSIVELTLNVTQIDLTLTPDIFQLTANQNNASYLWLDCMDNFSVVPNETDQTLMVGVFGEWAAEVTLDGCVDTTECAIPIYQGIDEYTNSLIDVYPIPAEEVLNIGNLEELSEVTTMEIITISGQRMWYSVKPNSEISVSTLPSGTYFLKVPHAKGVEVVKFVKR